MLEKVGGVRGTATGGRPKIYSLITVVAKIVEGFKLSERRSVKLYIPCTLFDV